MVSFNKVFGVKWFEKFGDKLVEELCKSCFCKLFKFLIIIIFCYNVKIIEIV